MLDIGFNIIVSESELFANLTLVTKTKTIRLKQILAQEFFFDTVFYEYILSLISFRLYRLDFFFQ